MDLPLNRVHSSVTVRSDRLPEGKVGKTTSQIIRRINMNRLVTLDLFTIESWVVYDTGFTTRKKIRMSIPMNQPLQKNPTRLIHRKKLPFALSTNGYEHH